MKIDTERLQKYARGLCTEQERLEVENWLSDPDTEIPSFSEKILHEAKAQMWAKIAPPLFEPEPVVIPLYKKLVPYIAAACIILVFSTAVYFTSLRSDMLYTRGALDNSASHKVEHLQIKDLELKLMPCSNALATVSTFTNNGTLRFSGYVGITNHSDNDIAFEARSMHDSGNKVKKVELKKNTEYLAFISETRHVYVMNRYDLMKALPPREYYKIRHTFCL